MGIKISSQDAFERAMHRNEKINRNNKTTSNKLPTLAEQLAWLDEYNAEQKRKRMEAKIESTQPRFSPLYDAKLKSEQSQIKQNKKK